MAMATCKMRSAGDALIKSHDFLILRMDLISFLLRPNLNRIRTWRKGKSSESVQCLCWRPV